MKESIKMAKAKKSDWIKLEDGQTIEGTIKGFGKNNFGVFVVLDSGILSLKAIVLQNIVKTNTSKFVKGAKLSVTRTAVSGKRYKLYEVEVNGEVLESTKQSDNLSELL